MPVVQIDRNTEAANLITSSTRFYDELSRLPVAGMSDEAIAGRFACDSPVYVALVFNDRRFGGREEGGWYFDTTQVRYQAPAFTMDTVAALVKGYRKTEDNTGAYGIGSVCSSGVYSIVISEEPQENQPSEQPFYNSENIQPNQQPLAQLVRSVTVGRCNVQVVQLASRRL
jgi:hypothetical protein